MSDCCDQVVYRRLFNSKEAKRRLKRYRKKGVSPLSMGMLDYLSEQGIDGLDLLEVGGGIGALEVELLKRGVANAVNVELSAGYDVVAAELSESEGLSGRIERRIGDFVEIREEIGAADIVLANAVICCYPFMEKMMSALLSKTRRYLVLVFPRERWWLRLFAILGALWFRIRRCAFRFFVHPVAEIERIAADDGLVPRYRDKTLTWHAVVWERAA